MTQKFKFIDEVTSSYLKTCCNLPFLNVPVFHKRLSPPSGRHRLYTSHSPWRLPRPPRGAADTCVCASPDLAGLPAASRCPWWVCVGDRKRWCRSPSAPRGPCPPTRPAKSARQQQQQQQKLNVLPHKRQQRRRFKGVQSRHKYSWGKSINWYVKSDLDHCSL